MSLELTRHEIKVTFVLVDSLFEFLESLDQGFFVFRGSSAWRVLQDDYPTTDIVIVAWTSRTQ